MGVFDKMLLPLKKQAFIEKKTGDLGIDENYLKDLTEYIYSSECDRDIRRLQSGEFFLDAPTRFFVRKHNSKKRRIVYSFRGRDKYLLQYITFVLMDLDSIHSDSLCSFRCDNRTRQFFRKVRSLDRDRKLYVMKTDIHNFGGSMDMDISLSLLKEIFADDPAFMSFLTRLLKRNEFYRRGELISESISVIEGLPLGGFIQSIYLSELDRLLEADAVIYMRYTDDIAFFTESREKAEQALETVRKMCGERAVTLNEDKSEIISPGQPVELLGVEIYPGGFDIGGNSMRKLLSKLKRFRDKQLRRERHGKCTRRQAMERMIRFADRTFFGIRLNDHEFNWVVHAFPIITRTDSLKRLDAFVQDCIRVVGSGKLGDSRYRIRYSDMRDAGYRTLLHAYYHGYTLEEVKKSEDPPDNADTGVG